MRFRIDSRTSVLPLLPLRYVYPPSLARCDINFLRRHARRWNSGNKKKTRLDST